MFILLVEEALRNAVVEAYTKEGKQNSVKRDLLELRRNEITTLKQWASLSTEDKKKYPDGLKTTLNNALAKSKFLISLDINNFVKLYIYIH